MDSYEMRKLAITVLLQKNEPIVWDEYLAEVTKQLRYTQPEAVDFETIWNKQLFATVVDNMVSDGTIDGCYMTPKAAVYYRKNVYTNHALNKLVDRMKSWASEQGSQLELNLGVTCTNLSLPEQVVVPTKTMAIDFNMQFAPKLPVMSFTKIAAYQLALWPFLYAVAGRTYKAGTVDGYCEAHKALINCVDPAEESRYTPKLDSNYKKEGVYRGAFMALRNIGTRLGLVRIEGDSITGNARLISNIMTVPKLFEAFIAYIRSFIGVDPNKIVVDETAAAFIELKNRIENGE